ncbi:MAG TPA: ABC transporter permease [Thermoanaerobaculia bacterium]|nr:ABC transporter permease [Thermoanaerobaculia bacterium]
MAIPLKYSYGNLVSRRVSTTITVFGIGVVIAVMISMLALYNGVKTAIVSSGSAENLIVLREGALTESTSWVTRDAYKIIRSLPGIGRDSHGEPLVSPELVMLFKLPKRDDPSGSNVNVRGVTPAAFEIRPYLRIVDGRIFQPGTNEMIVSRRVQRRFSNLEIGDSFSFGPRTWKVVGAFDGKGTSFDSEIWADAGYLGLSQKRDAYSSVLIRPADSGTAASIIATIKGDNRLKLQVKTELKYYQEQTSGLVGIIILVAFVTVFMVIGATLGTMNTMFAAVASRKRELATLRALGFRRSAILVTIVIESAVLSLLGGGLGLLLALPVNGISTGTTNFQTFSEVAFNFRISPAVAVFALALALVAGILGGLLPALGAARLPITTALREV